MVTLHLFTTNMATDVIDYLKPLKKYIYTFNVDLTSAFSKVIEVRLKKTKLITDSGLVFSEERQEEFVNLDTWISDIRDSNKIPSVLSIYFKMDNIIKEYKRIYDKVPDILAKFGGIAKTFLIIACLLAEPIVSFLFKQEIVKNIEKINNQGAEESVPLNSDQRNSCNYLELLKFIGSFGRKKSKKIKSLFERFESISKCLEIKELFHTWKWKKQKIRKRIKTELSCDDRCKEKTNPISLGEISSVNIEISVMNNKVINCSDLKEKMPPPEQNDQHV
jgi:hypothetical protein